MSRHRDPAGSQPARAARLALDTIGAAIAAHNAAGLPGIRRVIQGWGGRPDATVIGNRGRVPAHNAALVNSALARAMELDDVHEQALVHATATTVPVALAVAEQAGGVSGRRFIDAVALGNDIACRLALAVDMRLGGADRRPRVMSLTYQTGVLAGSLVAGAWRALTPLSCSTAWGSATARWRQPPGAVRGHADGPAPAGHRRAVGRHGPRSSPGPGSPGDDALEGRAAVPRLFGGRYGYSRDRLTGGLGERSAATRSASSRTRAARRPQRDHGGDRVAQRSRISPGPSLEVVVRVDQDTWDIICDPLELKASPEQLAALTDWRSPSSACRSWSTALLRGRLSAAELDAGWRAGPALASLLPKVRSWSTTRPHRT